MPPPRRSLPPFPRKEIGLDMIDAAVFESQRPNNSFKHFVFSSVLNTQHRNLMQNNLKSCIEERLMLSPLLWTILKPINFMDVYPVPLLTSQSHPIIERLWTPDIPNSVIALRHLAEAVEKVLLEGPGIHAFAEYPLSSTLPISDREIVEMIGKAIGKEISIKTPSFETGVSKPIQYLFSPSHAQTEADRICALASASSSSGVAAGSSGSGDATAKDFTFAAEGDLRGDICRDEAERLVLFYHRRGLKGSPNVLRWLLGREPMNVEEWVRGHLGGEEVRTTTVAEPKVGE